MTDADVPYRLRLWGHSVNRKFRRNSKTDVGSNVAYEADYIFNKMSYMYEPTVSKLNQVTDWETNSTVLSMKYIVPKSES